MENSAKFYPQKNGEKRQISGKTIFEVGKSVDFGLF